MPHRKPTAEQVRKAVQSPQEQPVRKPTRQRQKKQLDVSHIVSDPKYAGKKFGIFNNEGGQIQRLIREGWEPVKGEAFQAVWNPDANQTSQQDSIVKFPVGITRHSDSTEAILMMIDAEIWEEYSRQDQQQVDDIDRAMRQSQTATEQLGTAEKGLETYSPYTGTGTERGMSVKIQNE